MNTKACSLLFAIPSIVLGTAFSVSKNSKGVFAESKTLLDYSSEGTTLSVDADVVLDKVLDVNGNEQQISLAEREYLNSKVEFKFDGASNKTYNISEIDGYYVIEAFADSKYAPACVKTSSNSYSFEKLRDQYICVIPVAEVEGAQIVYKAWYELGVDDVNLILNSSYEIAEEQYLARQYLIDKEYYETNIDQYNIDLAAYQAYLIKKAEYDLKKANYDQYVTNKNKYDIAKAKYDAYLVAQSKYISDLAKYNDYLLELEAFSKNYPVFLEILEKYEKEMAIVDSQLQKMDVLFKKFGSLERSIHDFINSDSVDTVVQRKNEIIAAGVDARAVEAAGYNAGKCREYINNYYNLKNASKEERYSWYKVQYSRLRGYITKLTQCLEYFYNFSIVRSAIKEKGRDEKYVLLVAELMYFCDLINDTPVRSYSDTYNLDKNRPIGGKAGVYTSYLAGTLLDESLVAAPLNSSFPVDPAISIPGFVKPTEVSAPVKPTEVSRPIEPQVVEEPEAVEQVSNPGLLTEPVDPGFVFNPNFNALAEAFGNNEIVLRTEVSDAVSISIEDYAEIDSNNATECGFIFKKDNFSIIFDEVIFDHAPSLPSGEYCAFVSSGTTCSYDNSALGSNSVNDVFVTLASLTKKTKVNFDYVYEDESGNYVLTEKESGSTDVNRFSHPSLIDGLELDVPDYVDEVEDITFEYVLKGFDYAVDYDLTTDALWSIEGSNDYYSEANVHILYERRAKIDSSRVCSIGFEVDGVITNQEVNFGEMPVAPTNVTKNPSGNTYYVFSGWNSTIQPATSDKIYIAQFESRPVIEHASFEGNSENLLINVNKTVNEIDAERFFSYVKDGKISADKFTFAFSNGSFSIDKNEAVFLGNIGAKKLSFEIVKNDDEITVEPVIKNASGQKIVNNLISLEVEVNNVSDVSNARMFIGEKEIESNISGEYSIETSFTLGLKASIFYFYRIKFDESINKCTVLLNNNEVNYGSSFEFKKGDTVVISATPNDGFTLQDIYAIENHGSTVTVLNNELEVTSDVTIGASVEYIVCVVNFYVDDVIFQSFKVTYGTLINPPSNVTKPSTDTCSYVFIDWDKDVTYIHESEDIHAIFTAIQDDELTNVGKEATEGLSKTQKISICILALVVGGIVALLVIVAVKAHKKSKEE